jgi:hypothetical protein
MGSADPLPQPLTSRIDPHEPSAAHPAHRSRQGNGRAGDLHLPPHAGDARARPRGVAAVPARCPPGQLARDDGFTVHPAHGRPGPAAARHLVGLAPGAPRALRRGQHHQPPRRTDRRRRRTPAARHWWCARAT